MSQATDTLHGDGVTDDRQLAEMIVRQAYAQEQMRERKPVPGWVRMTMRALPRLLAVVTVANGLVAVVAVVAPILRLVLGAPLTEPIYTAYSFICPQRPSHTWFIGSEPMAMEQRMVVMYLVAGLAGALYLVASRLRQPLSTWIAAVLIAPVLIDVAISSVGIRPSTPLSRLWTGTLASLAVVWWAYPRFETQLKIVQEHVARMRAGHSGSINDG